MLIMMISLRRTLEVPLYSKSSAQQTHVRSTHVLAYVLPRPAATFFYPWKIEELNISEENS